VSIFNKTIDKCFPAEESTGTESEIKRLRARLATVEQALRACVEVLVRERWDEADESWSPRRVVDAARAALAGDAPGEGK
jgi:hypothetical protein